MVVFGEILGGRPFFGKVLLRKTVPCVGQKKKKYFLFLPSLGIRQVVRHRVLVPAFGGSNPSSPAIFW